MRFSYLKSLFIMYTPAGGLADAPFSFDFTVVSDTF